MLEYSLLEAQRKVRTLQDYMDQHIREPLRLDDLAAAVSVSKFHFARIFKRLTGETPMRVFRRRKVLAIDALLQADPSVNVTDLAFEFGYSSSSVLTREFREFLDCMPRTCKIFFQEEESKKLLNLSKN